VILVRHRGGDGPLEILLLRRHRGARFMSGSFVFPGGVAEPDDGDPRFTAARELFEEAGVLLADRTLPAATLSDWRTRMQGGAKLAALMAERGAQLTLDRLHYFAHWVTPSMEPRRYSARFFVAELPAEQTPSFDHRETVDMTWVTPGEALDRAGELRLPPPQVRTFGDLRKPAAEGMDALIAAAAERERDPHPILPRLCPLAEGFALLLPWDPDYAERGTGERIEMRADHPLADGPSRFVFEDSTWKNVFAPGSTSTG
jgi:8-oxo-dGTP pyrophosphatase MutT (NUDIX family)